MKVNKITTLICLIITLISGTFLFFIKEETICNILIGIFTGFIVSCVISLIGYFYEKEKIFRSIDIYMRSIYINTAIISKLEGIILNELSKPNELNDGLYRLIVNLSNINEELYGKINIELYNPILSKTKKSIACKKIIQFKSTIFTIRNISEKILQDVLNYKIEVNKFYLSENVMKKNYHLNNLNNIKNCINVCSAKLHEFTTAELFKQDDIAKDFYGIKNKKYLWDEIKKELLEETNKILQETSIQDIYN